VKKSYFESADLRSHLEAEKLAKTAAIELIELEHRRKFD